MCVHVCVAMGLTCVVWGLGQVDQWVCAACGHPGGSTPSTRWQLRHLEGAGSWRERGGICANRKRLRFLEVPSPQTNSTHHSCRARVRDGCRVSGKVQATCPTANEHVPHRDSASRLALEARRVHACPQHTYRTHSQKKRTQKGSSMHTDRRPVRRACREVLGLHRARNRQWLRVAAGHSPGAPGAQKTAP